MRKLALIGPSSCNLASNFDKTTRFTHFKLQFQQISRLKNKPNAARIVEKILFNFDDKQMLAVQSFFSTSIAVLCLKREISETEFQDQQTR